MYKRLPRWVDINALRRCYLEMLELVALPEDPDGSGRYEKAKAYFEVNGLSFRVTNDFRRLVNNGWCDVYVDSIKSVVQDATEEEAEGHVWVSWHGRHFDAEVPGGVSRPGKLPVYIRMKWVPEE